MQEGVSHKQKFINRISIRVGIVLALIGMLISLALYYVEQKVIEANKIKEFQAVSHQLYANLQHSISTLNLLNSINKANNAIHVPQVISNRTTLNQLFMQTPGFTAVGLLALNSKNVSQSQAITWLSDKPADIDEQAIINQLSRYNSIIEGDTIDYGLLSLSDQNKYNVLPFATDASHFNVVDDHTSSTLDEHHQLFVVLSGQKYQQKSQQYSLQNGWQHNNHEPPLNIVINYLSTASWLKSNPEFSSTIVKQGNLGDQKTNQSLALGDLHQQESQHTSTQSFFAQIYSKKIDFIFTITLTKDKDLIPSSEFGFFLGGLISYIFLASCFWFYCIKLQKEINEAALKVGNSNAHLAAIVNTSMDAIISASSDGLIKSFNPAAERIFGWDANEVIGLNLNVLMPEPYHSEHDGYLANYFNTSEKKVIGAERKVKGKHKHGRVFDIKLSVLESFIDDKPVYIGYISDLSENQALKTELSTFFDLSIDLYCLINFDGSFIQVNSAWSNSLGYEENELFALSYFKLVHPDDLDASMAEINRLYDSDFKMVEFENKFLTKEGEYRWFCWNAMYNRVTNTVYLTGHDITQQKQQQISMQLANDRMMLATDKLQELDGLKSMFIATMSHELRTPLNSIIGFSSVLLQGLSGDINDKQKDHLRRVNNASKHLLSMISDIIDVSKIEAERFDSINEEFDFCDVILEVVEAMAEQAKEYGIVINNDSIYSIKLITDRRRTKQVIMNLVSNAVKFSLKSEINIYTSLSDKYVEISIQDHGVGISKEEFNQLFLPFSRFKRLKMERSGTGLGLYLTKKIVENILMGQIKVQSVLNEGSTFSVIIPQDRPWQENKGSEYDETENSVNYRR